MEYRLEITNYRVWEDVPGSGCGSVNQTYSLHDLKSRVILLLPDFLAFCFVHPPQGVSKNSPAACLIAAPSRRARLLRRTKYYSGLSPGQEMFVAMSATIGRFFKIPATFMTLPRLVRSGLCIRDDCAAEDSAVFQIVNRFIDLLERESPRHQLI